MKVNVEEIEGIKIVSSLPKVIDASTAMEFKTGMLRVIDESTKIVFDMQEVKFMDSAGCGAIINILKVLKEAGGTLKLYAVQKQVRVVIELVRLYKIIDIFNTKEEVLKSFNHD